MAIVEKSVLVPYSAAQMFALVDDVAAYPQFLPWCGGSKINSVDGAIMNATVHIDYHHIKQSFTTRNERQIPHRIDITLLDGPFKHLDGDWRFIPLSYTACKIELRMHYEFSNILLSKILGPIFHYIASNLVDAFVHRAEKIYTVSP